LAIAHPAARTRSEPSSGGTQQRGRCRAESQDDGALTGTADIFPRPSGDVVDPPLRVRLCETGGGNDKSDQRGPNIRLHPYLMDG
jgi:hypothetical protein